MKEPAPYDPPMNDAPATVFVVDDDQAVRASLERLMRASGWDVHVFASAQVFLKRGPFSGTGCVLLDIRMPGLDGMQLHDLMSRDAYSLPVVFLTGHGDVPTGIRAMKKGAVDFLLKPVDDDVLVDTIRRAIERHAEERAYQLQVGEIQARLQRLSSREREVMDCVVRGRLNKQIADELRIAEKTVKVHRGRVMEKMEVRSVAELVHLALAAAGHGTKVPLAVPAPSLSLESAS